MIKGKLAIYPVDSKPTEFFSNSLMRTYGNILQQLLPAGQHNTDYCLSHVYLEFQDNNTEYTTEVDQTSDILGSNTINAVRVPIIGTSITTSASGYPQLKIITLSPDSSTATVTNSNGTFTTDSYIVAADIAASPNADHMDQDILWSRCLIPQAKYIKATSQMSIMWTIDFDLS